MNVAIAGAHGQVALRMIKLLTAADHAVAGLIRNPDHAADVQAAGATAAVRDLEQASVDQIAAAIDGVEAVVFAAGSGPGSGAARKLTMDRDGAIKLLEAAKAVGARRYLMLSGAGIEDPPQGNGVFEVYLRAKAEADAAVQASDRDWTILRPGRLTDEGGTGKVRIGTEPFYAPVPRDDVAVVLAHVLPDTRSSGRTLYLSSGTQSIDQALDNELDATP